LTYADFPSPALINSRVPFKIKHYHSRFLSQLTGANDCFDHDREVNVSYTVGNGTAPVPASDAASGEFRQMKFIYAWLIAGLIF
jgi:hypothetical protein